MNTQDKKQDVSQTQYFDPFPEPQTIPAGWDADAILSAPTSDSVQETEDSSGTEAN